MESLVIQVEILPDGNMAVRWTEDVSTVQMYAAACLLMRSADNMLNGAEHAMAMAQQAAANATPQLVKATADEIAKIGKGH